MSLPGTHLSLLDVDRSVKHLTCYEYPAQCSAGVCNVQLITCVGPATPTTAPHKLGTATRTQIPKQSNAIAGLAGYMQFCSSLCAPWSAGGRGACLSKQHCHAHVSHRSQQVRTVNAAFRTSAKHKEQGRRQQTLHTLPDMWPLKDIMLWLPACLECVHPPPPAGSTNASQYEHCLHPGRDIFATEL